MGHGNYSFGGSVSSGGNKNNALTESLNRSRQKRREAGRDLEGVDERTERLRRRTMGVAVVAENESRRGHSSSARNGPNGSGEGDGGGGDDGDDGGSSGSENSGEEEENEEEKEEEERDQSGGKKKGKRARIGADSKSVFIISLYTNH